MNDTTSPNIIYGLLSIHAVITRGLQVATEKSAAFAQKGFPDAASREGFASYLRCLISVLNVHHEAEDALAFPSFLEIMAAPYEDLTEQHRQMHHLLEKAGVEIESVAKDTDPSGALTRLNQILRGLQEIWHPHIAIEEEHFTVEKFASLLPPEEHRRMNKMFMEHMQQHTGPPSLILPFLLFNLSPEQRRYFAAEMPPEVTGQLVPVVWKQQWAPMQPFLLA
jgi:hypothetical protein